MPSKLEIFLASIWAKIRSGGKWILTAILVIALLIVGLIVFNKNNKDKDKETTNSRPEVAQIYEPSISTPLPPDTAPSDSSTNSSGEVSGAVTTVASTSTQTENFSAPKTGINPNEPIKYENAEFKFSVTLPTRSQVVEKSDSVYFYSDTGALLYSINVVNSSESLDQIILELKSSPDVNKISKTIFGTNPAINFSTKTQTGYVISKNNKIYYITGDQKYLINISL